jgi:CRISPR system Cascade subunit CasB
MDPAMTAPSPAKNTQEQFEDHDRFVASIVRLCADSTKARADLRTGLGRPLERCDAMHRYLVPQLGDLPRPRFADDRRRAHYTVASLIAARPRAARDADRDREEREDDAGRTQDRGNPDVDAIDWWKRPNLGATLGEAVNRGILKPDTAEADLHLMVRQGTDALQQRLPALTRHLLGSGLRIDWSMLLHDLARWNRDRDDVATRWLAAYFHVRDREAADLRSTDNPRS